MPETTKVTKAKPVMESWENRGTDDVAFGYVYFADGSRVGYSSDGTVWQPRTNGGGEYRKVTPAHLRMALKMLKDEGVITT
jgi:hypothetical protein